MRLNIAILGVLFLEVATGHLNSFMGVCQHNDVKVDCMPSCPRICMDHLMIRKCKKLACTPGCACQDGWVRKGSNTGPCIKRSSCKRWIL